LWSPPRRLGRRKSPWPTSAKTKLTRPDVRESQKEAVLGLPDAFDSGTVIGSPFLE
jgi:hypothetical protein